MISILPHIAQDVSGFPRNRSAYNYTSCPGMAVLFVFFYPEGLKLQAREESVAVTKCKVVFSQWKPIKYPTENINTVHANAVWGVNSWRGEE